MVRWPGAPGKDGKPTRKAKLFTNDTEAAAWAKDRLKELGDVGQSFGSMTGAERSSLTFWREFVAGVSDTPPPPLLAILQDYAERWKITRASVTVQVAVDSYEAAKKAEGLRTVSINSIRTRCSRFAKTFGNRPISSITSAEISDWLLGLVLVRQPGQVKAKSGKSAAPVQVGMQAKKNHRLALSGLFNYAKGRGWVKDNPVIDAAKPKPKKTRPGILRPGDVARFLATLKSSAPSLVPFWAVRFFAGIREQECLRMDWSMIDLAAKEIHLPDSVAKTGRSRTVKIEPALAAFLTPYQQVEGRIVSTSEMSRRYHLGKAMSVLKAANAEAAAKAKEAGVDPPMAFPIPMPANAARHSFATYHLMAFRHAGETALQLGHGQSPEMLHRHYKGVATEDDAKAFWAIRPAGAITNVIQINAPAKLTKAAKEKPSKGACL